MANDAPTHNSPFAPQIVHLGLGAFFRAHGALYLQDINEKSNLPWRITGTSMKSSRTRDVLIKSNYRTHVMEKGPINSIIKVLTIINKSLFLQDNRKILISEIVSRETFLVTMTITEKGYCRIPATGRLDLDHPDIQHDLRSDKPVSAIGLLVQA